jgi:cell division protein FtsW (lipid II flippase)
MGVTYTTASTRDARRRTRTSLSLGGVDRALAAASLLTLLLVTLAYQGRMRLTAVPPGAVNINAVAEAKALEPVLQPLFETSADARLAAGELFGHLVQADGARRSAPNVGALSRIVVPAATIEAARGAAGYRERLAEARARATEGRRTMPDGIPLFTAAQIAGLKPAVVVRDRGEVVAAVSAWVLLCLAGFHLVPLTWSYRGIKGDRLLLTIVHLLVGVGLAVMVSRPDPLRDVLSIVRYSQGIAVGLLVAAVLSMLDIRKSGLSQFSYLPLLGAVALSILLLVAGSGPGGSNVKVNLGPVQPIEAIRLLLALFLAGYFARNWEILRGVRERSVGRVRLPSWLDVPRVIYVVPVLLGVGSALLLFFFQRDLGPALMLAIVFLASWGIARGRAGMVLLGVTLLVAGFYLGYRLEISSTLAGRVMIWQSPWDNAARGGDQIAHALWAAATGGPIGAGLGLGDPRYVPAGDTDLVLAAIAEELGMLGILAVAALFIALVWRATSTALRASSDYEFFLAVILALFFAVPVVLMGAGVLGVLPLTGVVTPFLSFGGSAMVANFAAVGLLAAIRSDTRPAADLAIFRPAIRWVSGGFAVAAMVLLAAAVRVQVLSADDIAIRPHLGLQADGSRRYQYNPRVLDAARIIPRGSILDRNGLPLATDDRELIEDHGAALQKVGADPAACPADGSRCYPLGGRTFHLLGDANTRLNWSATNTSFVERDNESSLRGFDDRQSVVRAGGGGSLTVHRDYRDLLPMLRHRHQPDHPTVAALLARPRDVTLTIDARLQARAAEIIARHAAKSRTGRAAAVVIDPATGDLLASVSYPWPVSTRGASLASQREAQLDRARYGLYPPGSTFKLVTAAAALLKDPGAARTSFGCARLPDGRIGARISGYTRPIRDDVLDTQPHGHVDMRSGMVVSCNAYFAQLAARLGPAALLEAADRAGLSLAPGNAVPRIRDTLPQAGYGQGDVLASPLRMARVSAAIAADGRIRDVRTTTADAPSAALEFLPAESARQLGSFMREAVLNGTGRSVRNEPTAIAGKTGTAEVTGAASHAWFVGFAPYGQANARVAVAVIVENAGYGGTAAAPAAAEIVAAAAALGLAR